MRAFDVRFRATGMAAPSRLSARKSDTRGRLVHDLPPRRPPLDSDVVQPPPEKQAKNEGRERQPDRGVKACLEGEPDRDPVRMRWPQKEDAGSHAGNGP